MKHENETEYKKAMIRSYHRKLARYRLGLKCRDKWLRRRKVRYADDPIYYILWRKVCIYYKILSKILGQKYV